MKKVYKSPEIAVISVYQKAALLSSVSGSISDETTDRAYSRRGGHGFFDDDEE